MVKLVNGKVVVTAPTCNPNSVIFPATKPLAVNSAAVYKNCSLLPHQEVLYGLGYPVDEITVGPLMVIVVFGILAFKPTVLPNAMVSALVVAVKLNFASVYVLYSLVFLLPTESFAYIYTFTSKPAPTAGITARYLLGAVLVAKNGVCNTPLTVYNICAVSTPPKSYTVK